MLKDAINLSTLRRVLVIKLRHHGDVLLTSPVFSVLKNHAPHLEIDALVYQDTAEMLSLHPAISQLHTIDRKWKSAGIYTQAKAEWKLLSTLRVRHYDLIVHLTEHNRGAWLSRVLAPRYAVTRKLAGKSYGWYGSFTHHYQSARAGGRHIVEENLDALRRLGIYPLPDERKLHLIPGKAAEDTITSRLRSAGIEDKSFIHIHPTSRWLFKCWPHGKTAELIEKLQAEGYAIIVTSAPDRTELDMVECILNKLSRPPVNFAGQLTLKELAALASRAKLFVGVDSAPMHIAAAMGIPVAVLFGPSGEALWGPWEVPSRIITSRHSCRPCGNDGCGGGKLSECLTNIPVEAVVTAINELL